MTLVFVRVHAIAHHKIFTTTEIYVGAGSQISSNINQDINKPALFSQVLSPSNPPYLKKILKNIKKYYICHKMC